jgi:hypothetical protein
MHLEVICFLLESDKNEHIHKKFIYVAKLAFITSNSQKKRVLEDWNLDTSESMPPPPAKKSKYDSHVTSEIGGRNLRSSNKLPPSTQSQEASQSVVRSSALASSATSGAYDTKKEKIQNVSLRNATEVKIEKQSHWQEDYFEWNFWDDSYKSVLAGSESNLSLVVVKYIFGDYSSKATFHANAGRENIAPKLLGVAKLPGGVSMLIMEHLAEKSGWITFRAFMEDYKDILQRCSELKTLLTYGVTKMYRKFQTLLMMNSTSSSVASTATGSNDSTKSLVHGDIRPVNIMINHRNPGLQQLLNQKNDFSHHESLSKMIEDDVDNYILPNIRFIDFDWSGIEGEVKYPSSINHEVFTPLRNEFPLRSKLINPKHDMVMIQALFSEVK